MVEINEIAEMTLGLSVGNQISQNPWLKQKCLPPSPGPQEVKDNKVRLYITNDANLILGARPI